MWNSTLLFVSGLLAIWSHWRSSSRLCLWSGGTSGSSWPSRSRCPLVVEKFTWNEFTILRSCLSSIRQGSVGPVGCRGDPGFEGAMVSWHGTLPKSLLSCWGPLWMGGFFNGENSSRLYVSLCFLLPTQVWNDVRWREEEESEGPKRFHSMSLPGSCSLKRVLPSWQQVSHPSKDMLHSELDVSVNHLKSTCFWLTFFLKKCSHSTICWLHWVAPLLPLLIYCVGYFIINESCHFLSCSLLLPIVVSSPPSRGFQENGVPRVSLEWRCVFIPLRSYSNSLASGWTHFNMHFNISGCQRARRRQRGPRNQRGKSRYLDNGSLWKIRTRFVISMWELGHSNSNKFKVRRYWLWLDCMWNSSFLLHYWSCFWSLKSIHTLCVGQRCNEA